MINNKVAESLSDRALAAYYRSKKDDGQLMQPGTPEAHNINGRWYIRLSNTRGLLAVYRIREVGGLPVLKSLKRIPKELEAL